MNSESTMSKIKNLFSKLSDFDLKAFLPKLDTVLGWIELGARLAVMAGPLVLMGMGLWFFLAPTKEANRKIGYRTFFGMGSVKAWQFTQRLAGIVWSALGFVLTVVMGILCNGYRGMEAMDMVASAGKCILWQIILTAVSVVAIELTVAIRFDRKGVQRSINTKNRR